MGLDIYRGDLRIHWHYGALHEVRYAAAKAEGYKGTYEEWMRDAEDGSGREIPAEGCESNWWKKHKKYYQLIHFCDAEGMFLPKCYLEDVNYSKSYYVGCFDKLRDEVARLSAFMMKNASMFSEREMKYTGQLHEFLQNDEYENVVKFR